MSSSQDPQGAAEPPPDIAVLLGPQLIGLVFNWGLLGSLCNQVYLYYLCFPKDSKYAKLLVYSLFLAEITQTCMTTYDAFHWLVLSWGHPELLGDQRVAWFDVPIMTGIIASTVQISFAWRIWMLSRSRILAGTIVLISIAQGSAGIATGALAHQLPSFAAYGPNLYPTFFLWMGGSVVADIMIAVSMTFLLMRSRSGFRDTNYLIARLVRLSVETGTAMATVATVELLLFSLFHKNNNFFICPATMLAKLYTNSLMAVFNNRIFTPVSKPLASSTGSASADLEPIDYYRARFRDGLPSNGAKMLGGGAFPDSFKDRSRNEALRDIDLHPIPKASHRDFDF